MFIPYYGESTKQPSAVNAKLEYAFSTTLIFTFGLYEHLSR